MPRPRVTFSRNGRTSSGPSGPPKRSTSSASRRPDGAGSADGGVPPLLRTASDGSSSGRWLAGVMSTSVWSGTLPLLPQAAGGCGGTPHTPTAGEPPATCTISPGVAGDQSDSSATTALPAGSVSVTDQP